MRAAKKRRLKVSRRPLAKRQRGPKQPPRQDALKQNRENRAVPKAKHPELLGLNPNLKNQAEVNRQREGQAVLKVLLPNRPAVKQQQVNPLVQAAQPASRAEASRLRANRAALAGLLANPQAVSPPPSRVVRVVKFRDQPKASGVAAYSTRPPFSLGLEA